MGDALRPVAESLTIRNVLLASLSDEDFALLRPHFQTVATPPGTVMIRSGQPMQWVYFPQSSIVSIHERGGASAEIEVGLVGYDGMLGWSVLLGCPTAGHSATVCNGESTAIRLPAEVLVEACRARPDLNRALLRYIHVMTVQMSRALVSHLHDPLIRRLARWLLMRHDRVAGDELMVRHEEVADGLDVRRASVTDGLHILEGEHLVRCFRGRVVIRNRSELQTLALHAYGAPEVLYRDLIGPFGKGAEADLPVGAPKDGSSIGRVDRTIGCTLAA